MSLAPAQAPVVPLALLPGIQQRAVLIETGTCSVGSSALLFSVPDFFFFFLQFKEKAK